MVENLRPGGNAGQSFPAEVLTPRTSICLWCGQRFYAMRWQDVDQVVCDDCWHEEEHDEDRQW